MSASTYRVVRSSRASRIGLAVGALLVAGLAVLPYAAGSGTLRTLISFLTLVTVAQMWNLLAGYAGLLSVGQQAYIGLGAYALWVLADEVGVHPFVAVPLAGLIVGLIALPTAGLAFRLRGGYFAIGTWVIAEVYRLVIANIQAVGGGSGVTITAASHIARATRQNVTYWLALAVAVGTIGLVYGILRSRLGLALTAIRDDETSAESLGVHVFRTKLWVYVLSSFGCGLAGAVIYLNLLRIQPDAAFSVNWTALMIFVVVIGGVGTIEGPIIGAILYFILQETLADYGSWYLILVGLVAVVITLKAPRGLWGLLTERRPVHVFPLQRHVRIDASGEIPPVSGRPRSACADE
ncbi:MAG: branched-chain amino acid ABC transporter permease [Actinobacteria bacterium]|nr:branched-chain amino acid ABC transporter permease [Actinomycetota bacterium]